MTVKAHMIAPIVLIASLAACHDSTAPNLDKRSHPTGTLADPITGFAGTLYGVRLTRTGNIVTADADLNTLLQINSRVTARDTVRVSAMPFDVAVNSGGTVAVVPGYHDGVLDFVDLTRNRFVGVLRLPVTNISRAMLSTDESRVFATSDLGTVYAVDVSSRQLLKSMALSGTVAGLAVDRTGRSLYVSSVQGKLWRLDPKTLAVSLSVDAGCAAADVAVSTDDAEIYVACAQGIVQIRDAVTLQQLGTIPLPGTIPFAIAVTPDDAQLYVSSTVLPGLTIIDRARRAELHRIPLSGAPRRIAFSPSGESAYVGNAGRIEVVR